MTLPIEDWSPYEPLGVVARSGPPERAANGRSRQVVVATDVAAAPVEQAQVLRLARGCIPFARRRDPDPPRDDERDRQRVDRPHRRRSRLTSGSCSASRCSARSSRTRTARRSTASRTGSSTTCASIVFEHLTRMSFSFYDRVQSGQLISRANSDIRSVQMFLTFAPLVALNLVSFAVAVVFMFTIHVGLTLVALVDDPVRVHGWREDAQPDVPAVVDRAVAPRPTSRPSSTRT